MDLYKIAALVASDRSDQIKTEIEALKKQIDDVKFRPKSLNRFYKRKPEKLAELDRQIEELQKELRTLS